MLMISHRIKVLNYLISLSGLFTIITSNMSLQVPCLQLSEQKRYISIALFVKQIEINEKN